MGIPGSARCRQYPANFGAISMLTQKIAVVITFTEHFDY
jgi:hypothetical protein